MPSSWTAPWGRSNDLTYALRTKRRLPSLMLCNWPVRAHRPIVSDVNLMFAAARTPAASEREIQSAGGFDIGQSGSFAAFAAIEAEPSAGARGAGSEPEDPDEPLDSPADAPLSATSLATRDGRLADFSLRAQPEPL